jgi:hypothetical protein
MFAGWQVNGLALLYGQGTASSRLSKPPTPFADRKRMGAAAKNPAFPERKRANSFFGRIRMSEVLRKFHSFSNDHRDAE